MQSTSPYTTQDQLRLQTVFQHEQTEEYQHETRKGQECWSMNYNRISKPLQTAITIMAREYKGFGGSTELSNGVIESD